MKFNPSDCLFLDLESNTLVNQLFNNSSSSHVDQRMKNLDLIEKLKKILYFLKKENEQDDHIFRITYLIC